MSGVNVLVWVPHTFVFRFSFNESKRNFEEITSSTVSWMSLSNFTIFLFIFWDAHVFLKLRNSGRKGWKKNKKTGVSVLTIFWLDDKADSSLWFLIDDRIIRIRRIIIFKYFKKHLNYARLRACVEIASFIDKTPEIWRFFCVSKLSLPHARQWLWMLAEIKWKRWKKNHTQTACHCVLCQWPAVKKGCILAIVHNLVASWSCTNTFVQLHTQQRKWVKFNCFIRDFDWENNLQRI